MFPYCCVAVPSGRAEAYCLSCGKKQSMLMGIKFRGIFAQSRVNKDSRSYEACKGCGSSPAGCAQRQSRNGFVARRACVQLRVVRSFACDGPARGTNHLVRHGTLSFNSDRPCPMKRQHMLSSATWVASGRESISRHESVLEAVYADWQVMAYGVVRARWRPRAMWQQKLRHGHFSCSRPSVWKRLSRCMKKIIGAKKSEKPMVLSHKTRLSS